MTGGPSNPSLGKSDSDKVRETLERNGATEAEIAFLLGDDDHGPQRIELNALVSSRRFIDFIERKLAAHGFEKVIPDIAALADAYRLFFRGARALAAAVAAREHAPIDVPADLDERVRALHDLLRDHTRFGPRHVAGGLCRRMPDRTRLCRSAGEPDLV